MKFFRGKLVENHIPDTLLKGIDDQDEFESHATFGFINLVVGTILGVVIGIVISKLKMFGL